MLSYVSPTNFAVSHRCSAARRKNLNRSYHVLADSTFRFARRMSLNPIKSVTS
jgi:hypothetical protein